MHTGGSGTGGTGGSGGSAGSAGSGGSGAQGSVAVMIETKDEPADWATWRAHIGMAECHTGLANEVVPTPTPTPTPSPKQAKTWEDVVEALTSNTPERTDEVCLALPSAA